MEGGLVSTPVPNTGYVENVYFNTDLSVDEVVSLLSQLNYTTSSFIDIPIYGLLYKHTWIDNEWVDLILSVFKFDDLNYAILDFDNMFIYFATENVPDMPLDFVGWNPSLNSEVIVNGDVSDSLQDISFGTQNDLISSLFSSTPFEYLDGESFTKTDNLVFGSYEYKHFYKEKMPIKGQYIESFVISKNETLLYELANSLNIAENNGKTIFSFNNQFFNICNMGTDGSGITHYALIICDSFDTFDLNGYFVYCPSFMTDNINNAFGINAPYGFNTILSYEINSSNYFYNSFISDYVDLFSDNYFDYYEKVYNKFSFFDITLEHTTNTFSNFQLPFLKNGLVKVFGFFAFQSNVMTNFVITTFVWFIQFMLLHVLVDTLTFIFKLYHKLMEKVV